MKVVELNIDSTPALIIGEKSEKVFLFVHGLHRLVVYVVGFPEQESGAGIACFSNSRYEAVYRADATARGRLLRVGC